MAARHQDRVYAQPAWALDPGRRELHGRGGTIPLGGRAFDVAEVLVQAGGSVVTKDAIMTRVWPGLTVEDNTLQVHVSAFRKALGADRSLLQTSSGRGYRLLGSWTTVAPPAAATARASPAALLATSNLPLPGTALIGRDGDLQLLRDLVSAYRVVTLTGAGGMGKTRLALACAHALMAPFQGLVWLAELAPLADPGLLPSLVSGVLGLALRGEITADSVAQAVGERRLLLVLDNCEHLADAAARLVAAITRVCPNASILATSRELLRIEGEYAYRVPTLDLPPAHGLAPDPLDYSAIQLFVARILAGNSGFVPQAESLPAITAICRRLDGIPLAIELAAARAATLGVHGVLARLDDRFALLIRGRRTALPRHQTLLAALDWSYGLLTEGEQRLLRSFAVFAGGFTLEGAAAVMAKPAADILGDLGGLVAKSLVIFDGRARWRLMETMRAYAGKKLADHGEAGPIARRHALFFRDLLIPAAAASRLSKASLAGYTSEIDNIRAALDWAFAPDGDGIAGVALTVAALPLWVQSSLMGECRSRVETALAIPAGDAIDKRQRMQLSAALGWSLTFAVGQARETGAAWSATLDLAESLGDLPHQLRALWGLWVDDLNHGAFRKALDLAARFANVAAHSNDPMNPMVGDLMLATSLHFLGDQHRARHHMARMLQREGAPAPDPAFFRFDSDQWVTAHYFQARILWLQGFADQATQLVDRNVAEACSLGQPTALASVLGRGACLIALFCGDLPAAERFGAMLRDHADRHGLRLWQDWARCFNALVRVRQGDLATGLPILRRGLSQTTEARVLLRYLVLSAGLAEGLGQAGEVASGLAIVDGALTRCEVSEGRWYVPELLRIKGELLLRLGRPDATAAAALFSDAIGLAQRQGALAWSLRAALSLAHCDRGQDAARAQLAAIYGQFTEGFATADLQMARHILAA